MEVSGQCHALAALPLGKDPVHIYRRLSGHQHQFGGVWRRENVINPPGFESGRIACSELQYQLFYVAHAWHCTEQYFTFDVWLTVHRSSMWNKKPTRCHLDLYLFLLYKLLNMFRATLCPSSGADDLVVFLPRVV